MDWEDFFDSMSIQRLNLKQAITQILSCALQPQSEIQRLTEERKKALEMTEDYPFILIDIIESQEALPERIMAATFLKNYVIGIQKNERERVGLKIDWEKKLALNSLNLLSNENNIIRELVSATLNILIKEFNENNVELIQCIYKKVINYLLSENRNELEGAIKLMNEMAYNRQDDSKYPYFSPEYIEPLLNVLHNENYPISLRASTIVCMVEIWKSCKNDAELFATTHDRLLEVFENLLRQPYHPKLNNFKLKGDIIFGIILSLVRLGDDAVQLVNRCLQPIGNIYSNCCNEIKSILMGLKQVPKDSEEDDELQSKHFSRLLLFILELIENILHVPSCISLLTPCLNDFVYLLFFLMCSVDDDEGAIFLETNIDDIPKHFWSVRSEASNTLLAFMGKFDYNMFTTAIHTSIQKHLSEAHDARSTSEMYYLRVFEALMYGLGVLNAKLDEPIGNLLVYVEQWSLILQNHQQVNWFILGRLLWLGSKFSQKLSMVNFNYHIIALITYFKCDNESLRIACISSMKTHLKLSKNNPNILVISNHLNEITECLFSINLDNHHLSIEFIQSFNYFFKYIPETTTNNNTQRILEAIIYILHNHFSNTRIIGKLDVLLSTVMSFGNKDMIKQHFVPFAFSLVYKEYEPLKTRSDIVERGFDLLNTNIKFSPDNVDDDLIIECFQAAYKNITDLEDISHVEAATILLINLIMKSTYKIKELHDNKGKILADYVPNIVFQLLDTTHNEQFCPSQFGRFTVISIMCLTEHFQPFMESILKSLITFLQRAKKSVSLINCYLIFSYIFVWQTENIMNFLSNIPGPDGKCALSFFLNKWTCDLLSTEIFEKRIMTLGICKMIEFSLTNNDNRINDCGIELEQETYSGLEKLYLLLIKIFLNEVSHEEYLDDFIYSEKESTNDVLIKNHPIYNINLAEHIKSFIRNYNNIHYFNVVKKYVTKFEVNLIELENHGIQPHIVDLQLRFNE